MTDKVYSYCIKALQHIYQQIIILDSRGENTDDFVEIYEATYIILKSKIDFNRDEITNADIENTEDLYHHSIKAVVLMLIFIREGLIKFGKKEIIPFRPVYTSFLDTVKKYTKKNILELLEDLVDYDDKVEKEPEGFRDRMMINVKLDT